MPKNSQTQECKQPDRLVIKPVTHKAPSAFTVQEELEKMNEKLNAIGTIASRALQELVKVRLATRPFQRSDIIDWDACDKWVKADFDAERVAANTALVEQAKASQAQMKLVRG